MFCLSQIKNYIITGLVSNFFYAPCKRVTSSLQKRNHHKWISDLGFDLKRNNYRQQHLSVFYSHNFSYCMPYKASLGIIIYLAIVNVCVCAEVVAVWTKNPKTTNKEKKKNFTRHCLCFVEYDNCIIDAFAINKTTCVPTAVLYKWELTVRERERANEKKKRKKSVKMTRRNQSTINTKNRNEIECNINVMQHCFDSQQIYKSPAFLCVNV